MKMKGRGVFVGFKGFSFVVIKSAEFALEISGPQMLAVIDLSYFVHFSIKIIN
jgi:hypothetical protein